MTDAQKQSVQDLLGNAMNDDLIHVLNIIANTERGRVHSSDFNDIAVQFRELQRMVSSEDYAQTVRILAKVDSIRADDCIMILQNIRRSKSSAYIQQFDQSYALLAAEQQVRISGDMLCNFIRHVTEDSADHTENFGQQYKFQAESVLALLLMRLPNEVDDASAPHVIFADISFACLNNEASREHILHVIQTLLLKSDLSVDNIGAIITASLALSDYQVASFSIAYAFKDQPENWLALHNMLENFSDEGLTMLPYLTYLADSQQLTIDNMEAISQNVNKVFAVVSIANKPPYPPLEQLLAWDMDAIEAAYMNFKQARLNSNNHINLRLMKQTNI